MSILIFCAGAPNPNLSPLHEPHDLLVGVDGGATTLVAHGFTPDWAIGDFDSAPPPQACRQIVHLPREKDDTDLEYALQHILAQHPPEQIKKIIILGALNGGRLDHLLGNIYLAHQQRFRPYLEKFHFIEQNNSVRFYVSGSHTLQREPDKQYLSFIGLTPICQLSLQHVKYPLNKKSYYQATALISNEFLCDTMHFSFDDGILCVIQSNDSFSGSLK